jgi:hypothetical protein
VTTIRPTPTEEATAPAPIDRRVERYDATSVEPKWQAKWEELRLHHTDLGDTRRRRF